MNVVTAAVRDPGGVVVASFLRLWRNAHHTYDLTKLDILKGGNGATL